MFRALGCFGLGILFLAISPDLRMTVGNGIEAMEKAIETYSPISYVMIAVGVLATLMILIYRAAQPRV